MAHASHPPTFRLGALHHFPEGGGPVLSASSRAYDTRAGRALAACSNDRRGMLVLDSDEDARWIARRGDLDEDHSPEVWWTGRAKRGETFHFGAWYDGSIVVALTHERVLLAHPVIVCTPERIDLGALGARWALEWLGKQGRFGQEPSRSHWGQARGGPQAVVFPEMDTGSVPIDLARAAAVARAGLLQALSDLAHAIPTQPPVLWPITRTPRPGWTVPPFANVGAPPRPTTERAREVHAVLFPAVARAFAARHIAPTHPPFTVEVQPARMAGDGTLAPPGLYVPNAPLRAFPTTEAGQRFKVDLQDTFARALAQGRLGPLLAWRDEHGNTLDVTFDPSLFSRHAILAALAPPPRAPRRAPPPPDADAPWWAGMAPPDA